MLGALSLKWNWRKRREAAGESAANPNLVFGGDVHVVWEKFCRYFDVEPRIVPLQKGKYTIGPDDVESVRGREHDRGGCCPRNHFHRTQGRHRRHQHAAPGDQEQARHGRPAARGRGERRFRVALPLPRFRLGLPSRAGAVHQRLRSQVRARVPGDRLADLSQKKDLAPDLVFEENYLGKTDSTFTLNFSTGSAMVLAQYYNLVRYGRAGYTYILNNMRDNARMLAEKLQATGRFELIGAEDEQLPLVAFQLARDEAFDEFDVAWQLSAERGWMVPAYTLPPDAQDVTIMRALVKQTLSREHVDTLVRDIANACTILESKGERTPRSEPGSSRARATDAETIAVLERGDRLDSSARGTGPFMRKQAELVHQGDRRAARGDAAPSRSQHGSGWSNTGRPGRAHLRREGRDLRRPRRHRQDFRRRHDRPRMVRPRPARRCRRAARPTARPPSATMVPHRRPRQGGAGSGRCFAHRWSAAWPSGLQLAIAESRTTAAARRRARPRNRTAGRERPRRPGRRGGRRRQGLEPRTQWTGVTASPLTDSARVPGKNDAGHLGRARSSS